jgi:hypothetical protein
LQSVSRSLICLTLFCVTFQPPTAAGATSESLPPAPPDLIRARGLCDQGRYLEAIELFDRILEGPIGKVADAEVDAALDRCMLLVEQADDSDALLATIKSREGNPSGLLRALTGAGIVDSGSGLDRFLSTESAWPSEWWSFGFLLVVLAAITEEVLYRGVLHEALRRAVPVPAAAVLGSFVFAMAHTRPVQYTVGVFVMGIVLVLVRERFRSLAPGAIVHSLWNLLVFWLR